VNQNKDGGWGLHAEGESSMLSTALNYTALRLLGKSVDDGPDMSMPKARKWIHDHGGATMIPILGKVWLSVTILLLNLHNCNSLVSRSNLTLDLSNIALNLSQVKQGLEIY
jgi:squalene cyclase